MNSSSSDQSEKKVWSEKQPAAEKRDPGSATGHGAARAAASTSAPAKEVGAAEKPWPGAEGMGEYRPPVAQFPKPFRREETFRKCGFRAAQRLPE